MKFGNHEKNRIIEKNTHLDLILVVAEKMKYGFLPGGKIQVIFGS
jgi:hypothetical protein